MMRVAITGMDKGACRELTLRLRGASVEPSDVTLMRDVSAENFDAVAFFGSRTPNSVEVERLLVAGKHVLLTVDACPLRDRMEAFCRIAQQAAARLSVVNPDHALPSRQLIRQQIASGKLGEVGLVRIHRWESPVGEDTADRGGLPGPVVGDFELAMWLFDKSPDVVYAIEHTVSEPAIDTGKHVQVHLGFSGGGMALITYSGRLPPGDGYQSLSVIGSSGAAYSDDHQDRQLVFAGGVPRAVRGGEGTVVAPLVQEFVDAVGEGRDMSAGLSAWTRVWEAVAAAQRSIESRQAIQLEAH